MCIFENANVSTTERYNNSTSVWYEQATRSLWIYLSPCLIIVGLCGNVLSAVVFQCRSLRGSCISVCLVALAAVDSTLLIHGLGRLWVKYTFGYDVRELTEGACQYHVSLVYFLFQYEAWILVTISMERFISVALPFKAHVWCTWRVAVTTLTSLLVIFVCVNLHFYWTYSLGESHQCCSPTEKAYAFIVRIWQWLDFLLAVFLPFTLMLIFNIIVCVKLCRLDKHRKQHSTTSNKDRTSKTAMLLSVTFTFLILEAPLTVYLGLAEYNEIEVEEQRSHFIWSSLSILAYSNYCANFFLYCVSSKVFRRDLAQLLCPPQRLSMKR